MSKKADYKAQALALLTREMPFADFMDECRAAGIPADILQGWPAWKAAGEVVARLSRTEQGGFALFVSRGG